MFSFQTDISSATEPTCGITYRTPAIAFLFEFSRDPAKPRIYIDQGGNLHLVGYGLSPSIESSIQFSSFSGGLVTMAYFPGRSYGVNFIGIDAEHFVSEFDKLRVLEFSEILFAVEDFYTRKGTFQEVSEHVFDWF